MKNKGEANVILLIFMAVIFMVACYIAVAGLGAVYSANTNGCTVDENNSVHNCTQSDYAYREQNKTMTIAVPMISVSTNMIWVLVIAVVIGVLAFMYKSLT